MWVTDGTGAAIAGASVRLECGGYYRQVPADGEGRFLLSVPAGSYGIRVEATGFAPEVRTVALTAGMGMMAVRLGVAMTGETVTVEAGPDYVTSDVASGTKTDTPLIDTPQSITAVTLAQMEARDTQTIAETLRYAAGVDPEPYGTDTRVDWFFIRGFGETFDGLFLDGLALPKITGADAAYTSNPFSLQEVDILKGPASVLYGQAEPGGLVNLLSKRREDWAPEHVFDRNASQKTDSNPSKFTGGRGCCITSGQALRRTSHLRRRSIRCLG